MVFPIQRRRDVAANSNETKACLTLGPRPAGLSLPCLVSRYTRIALQTLGVQISSQERPALAGGLRSGPNGCGGRRPHREKEGVVVPARKAEKALYSTGVGVLYGFINAVYTLLLYCAGSIV